MYIFSFFSEFNYLFFIVIVQECCLLLKFFYVQVIILKYNKESKIGLFYIDNENV